METKPEVNADSHIFLYAKGWYKRTNTMNDLRKIYARRNGCEEKHISNRDILNILCSLVFPYLTKSEHLFNSIILRSFRVKNKFPWPPKASNTTTVSKLVLQILSVLADMRIKEKLSSGDYKILIPLDEPDYTILPRLMKDQSLKSEQK